MPECFCRGMNEKCSFCDGSGEMEDMNPRRGKSRPNAGGSKKGHDKRRATAAEKERRDTVSAQLEASPPISRKEPNGAADGETGAWWVPDPLEEGSKRHGARVTVPNVINHAQPATPLGGGRRVKQKALVMCDGCGAQLRVAKLDKHKQKTCPARVRPAQHTPLRQAPPPRKASTAAPKPAARTRPAPPVYVRCPECDKIIVREQLAKHRSMSHTAPSGKSARLARRTLKSSSKNGPSKMRKPEPPRRRPSPGRPTEVMLEEERQSRRMDGSRGTHNFRDHGQFGSYPSFDRDEGEG